MADPGHRIHDRSDTTATDLEPARMIPADTLATALSLVPAAIFVAILAVVGAIVWSVISTAEPRGPRTMDPAASWRADD
jgi:hypothetical protein